MPQSLARVAVHLVFSTKLREPFLTDAHRPATFEYLAGLLRGAGCAPIAVGGMPDHVHLLFGLTRTLPLCGVVEVVKKRSSVWAKGFAGPSFAWQAGYGAFSVGESGIAEVQAYIRDQEQHHADTTFQEEYRRLLRENGAEYDERYVWD